MNRCASNHAVYLLRAVQEVVVSLMDYLIDLTRSSAECCTVSESQWLSCGLRSSS